MKNIYNGLTIELDGNNVELSDALKKAEKKYFKLCGEARGCRLGDARQGHGIEKLHKRRKWNAKKDKARMKLLSILVTADKQLKDKMTKKQYKQLQKEIFSLSNPYEQRALGFEYRAFRKVYRVIDNKKILVNCQ